MKRNEVKEILIAKISDNVGIPEHEINEDSNFKDDLDFDSLDDIELIMDMEIEFYFSINDDEVENVETVKEAIDLIMNRFS